MKLLHVSLTARHADALSAFYREAFGFITKREPRRLSGDIVARGNGLANGDIYQIWLEPPHASDVFLEIMQYEPMIDRDRPVVNAPGYGHLAFEVQNIQEVVKDVLRFGGSLQGKITNFGSEDRPYLIVYVRDPEGNIIELEQPSRDNDLSDVTS